MEKQGEEGFHHSQKARAMGQRSHFVGRHHRRSDDEENASAHFVRSRRIGRDAKSANDSGVSVASKKDGLLRSVPDNRRVCKKRK